MKKLIMAALLLGVVCVAKSEAADAKSYFTHRYTTTASTVAFKDAALYSVIMTTAATSGDYINIYDSSTVTGLATTYVTSAPFVMRLYYSTATATGSSIPGNTIYTFNPPIQFNDGIVVVPNSAAEAATLIYEGGRP